MDAAASESDGHAQATERRYPLPQGDGVTINQPASVMLVRIKERFLPWHWRARTARRREMAAQSSASSARSTIRVSADWRHTSGRATRNLIASRRASTSARSSSRIGTPQAGPRRSSPSECPRRGDRDAIGREEGTLGAAVLWIAATGVMAPHAQQPTATVLGSHGHGGHRYRRGHLPRRLRHLPRPGRAGRAAGHGRLRYTSPGLHGMFLRDGGGGCGLDRRRARGRADSRAVAPHAGLRRRADDATDRRGGGLHPAVLFRGRVAAGRFELSSRHLHGEGVP